MIATLAFDRKLSAEKEGSEGTVAHFTDQFLAGKLIAMGILPGSHIKLIRRAPFGNGLYIKVDGNLLALRQTEAACIVIK